MRTSAGRVDRRADVVERPGGRPASRGSAARPMPIRPPIDVPTQCDGVGVEAGEQGHHVGHVARQRVAHRVGAASRIGRGRPRRGRRRGSRRASRAPARRSRGPGASAPCGADQHPVVGRIAPLPVRHAVQAARVEALHACASRGSFTRRLLRVRHFICTLPLTVAVTCALPGSTAERVALRRHRRRRAHHRPSAAAAARSS